MFCGLFSVSVKAATREECINAVISYTTLKDYEADESVLEQYPDAGGFVSEWSKNRICTAIEKGIINGYEDGSLRLKQEVTRAEFACVLYRVRDFIENSPENRIEYKGSYKDLSDWNTKEIYHCIENGYLIGYGNEFGCNDVITSQQLSTISRRISAGLTTREKYLWLGICGDPLIHISDMLMSAYDEELLGETLPSRASENIISVNSAENAFELENLLELQGNIDYQKLNNEKYKEFILNNFRGQGYAGSNSISIIKENNTTSIEEKLKNAEEYEIIRESIFVLSPLNNVRSSLLSAYNRLVGVGYEYYCYQKSLGETPNGEVLGTWYRRKVIVDYIQHRTHSTDYSELICKYGVPEKM